MSRYACHQCKNEHGTDNMVAYCASCYHRLTQENEALRKRVEELEAEERHCIDARLKASESRAESLQRRVDELEAEKRGMVPRSRYDLTCEQYTDAESKRKATLALAEQFLKRAEFAEKARDEENRVNKQHSECLDARDRRIAELEQRLANMDAAYKTKDARVTELLERVALYEAPFNEKELDEAIAWAKSAIVFAEAWAGGEPQKHGKVLASAVRSLRGKLDEAVKALEKIEDNRGGIVPWLEARKFLDRIRGGR